MKSNFQLSLFFLLSASTLLCSTGCADTIQKVEEYANSEVSDTCFEREITTLDGTILHFQYTTAQGLHVEYEANRKRERFTELPILQDDRGQHTSLQNLPYDTALLVVEEGKWEVNKLRKGLQFLGVRGAGGGKRAVLRLESQKKFATEAHVEEKLQDIRNDSKSRVERRKTSRELFSYIKNNFNKESIPELLNNLLNEYLPLLIISRPPQIRARDSSEYYYYDNLLDIIPQQEDRSEEYFQKFLDMDPEDSNVISDIFAPHDDLKHKTRLNFISSICDAFINSRILYDFTLRGNNVCKNDLQRNYVANLGECITTLSRNSNFIQLYCITLRVVHQEKTSRGDNGPADLYIKLMVWTYLDIIRHNIATKKQVENMMQLMQRCDKIILMQGCDKIIIERFSSIPELKNQKLEENEKLSYILLDFSLSYMHDTNSLDYLPAIAKYYNINPATYMLNRVIEPASNTTSKLGSIPLGNGSFKCMVVHTPRLLADSKTKISVPLLLYPLLLLQLNSEELDLKLAISMFTKMMNLARSIEKQNKNKGKGKGTILDETVITCEDKRSLATGSSQHYPDYSGCNAMALACLLGSKALVEQLTKSGANINCETKFKYKGATIWSTPYHFISVKAGVPFLEWMHAQKGLKIPFKLDGSDSALEYNQINSGNRITNDYERVIEFMKYRWILKENEIFNQFLQREQDISSPTIKISEVSKQAQSAAIVDDRHYEVKNVGLKEGTKEIPIKEDQMALDPREKVNMLHSHILALKEQQIQEAKQHRMEMEIKKLELEKALLNMMISEHNREENKNTIIQLLENNPELQLHALSSFFHELVQKNEASEFCVQDEILSSFPQMLNRYCMIKKEYNMQQIKALQSDNAGEENFKPENLYPINSGTLVSKAFIYLHPYLMGAMDNDNNCTQDFKKRIINQLIDGISFIKATSQDISGIKMYQGVAKIKLTGEGQRIFISNIYRDAIGNLLLVAKNIVPHNKAQGVDTTPYKYGEIINTEKSIRAVIKDILEAHATQPNTTPTE